MTNAEHLSWRPDRRLPTGKGASLQEFISHAGHAELRIILHIDQHAEVEVNGRLVAETSGFQNAATLAELYMQGQEILCTSPQDRPFCAIRPIIDGYQVQVSDDIVDLASAGQASRPMTTAATLGEALTAAATVVGGPFMPVFLDQRELYTDLGEHSLTGLAVAVWASRWQLNFTDTFANAPAMLASFSVARATDGAYYTIYRLVNGKFLIEMRSRHRAEKIAEVDASEAARAYCALHNAARHAQEWQRLEGTADSSLRAEPNTTYSTEVTPHEQVLLSTRDTELLGRFPSLTLAEAYATAHRDMLSHFHHT